MDTETKQNFICDLSGLTDADCKELQDIIAGKKLAPIMSDIVSKKLFSPRSHPDRLTTLLQLICKDNTIYVKAPAEHEGYVRFVGSKKIIFDIPAILDDERYADLEIQVAAQNFIIPRTELYSSNALLMQYSVSEGQKKAEVNVESVKGGIIIVLMRHSPKIFREFNSKRYIHRQEKLVTDSGLEYSPLCKTIYIQMDKCLDQFLNGENGEDNNRLQLILATIADVNNPKVVKEAKEDEYLKNIIDDLTILSQDKEVQQMLTEEFLAAYDASAIKETGRQEGIEEGILKEKINAIERIMSVFHVTKEDACQTMGISKEMYEKIKMSAK